MARGGIEVEGLEGLEATLGDLSQREARNLNRATIHAMAGRVRDDARLRAPKDKGTLKKAIKAKRRRPRNPDQPFSDIMVEHGNDAKHDAFYWRFVEYGTQTQGARPFIGPAADALRPDVARIYREEFMRKYARFLERRAKK